MTGTLANPATIYDATRSARVRPGDTIVCLPGTYTGDFVIPSGVTLQPAPGARVVFDIDDSFRMDGATVKDVEIKSHLTDRSYPQAGIAMDTAESRLIGCYIHDISSNGVTWYGGGAGEVSECVIHNVGYTDSVTDEGFCHCIYTHNNEGGARLVDNNIFVRPIGKRYGLHIYSGGENALKDYTALHNITMRFNTIAGGGLGVSNLVYRENVQAGGSLFIGRYSPEGTNVDCVVRDNWGPLPEITGFQTVDEGDNNLLVSGAWLFPCTKSARKLAHVFIANLESSETFDVDLSGLSGLTSGATYRMRNAFNLNVEWFDFVYSGALVAVPMTGWTSAPDSSGAPHTTNFPTSGAFVLEAI